MTMIINIITIINTDSSVLFSTDKIQIFTGMGTSSH